MPWQRARAGQAPSFVCVLCVLCRHVPSMCQQLWRAASEVGVAVVVSVVIVVCRCGVETKKKESKKVEPVLLFFLQAHDVLLIWVLCATT